MVEPIRKSTREEREQWIKEAHYNVFQLKAKQMSDRQWAGIMTGDESYAGAESFFRLKEMIKKLTGFEYVIPTHQGRAAENVLFSYLVREGDIVPGNSHFDTTKGHIEGRKAIALDCTVDESKDTQLEVPFKGNVDPVKLENALKIKWGERFNRYLPFLWEEQFSDEVQAKVRYDYMDMLSRLVSGAFSLQIGKWCNRHGVEYIGHLIEDNNQDTRTGNGLAHFFRAQAGQNMSGIDDIGGQVLPQGEYETQGRNGLFYHFVLGKLGSSAAAMAFRRANISLSFSPPVTYPERLLPCSTFA